MKHGNINKLTIGMILALFTIVLGGCGFDMVKNKPASPGGVKVNLMVTILNSF